MTKSERTRRRGHSKERKLCVRDETKDTMPYSFSCQQLSVRTPHTGQDLEIERGGRIARTSIERIMWTRNEKHAYVLGDNNRWSEHSILAKF